jgi:hypothetical protein
MHSFHCLIDVPSCVNSHFDVLLEPAEPGQLYTRGFRLDDPSQAKAVELAKQVGMCDTCVGDQPKGFRAAMTATVSEMNSADGSVPPTITIKQIMNSNEYVGTDTSACQALYGMEDITDMKTSSGGSFLDGLAVNPNNGNSAQAKFRKRTLAHGSLMLVGWGLLLPSGTITARFFKHRPDGLWFKIHRALQIFGLLLALAGWVIALVSFSVFGNKGLTNYRHGICGMVVMVLGLLQPINAFLRPHPPKDGEEKSSLRQGWECLHKSSGWIAVALAVPTIVLGTMSLPNPETTRTFQIAYGGGCWGLLVLLTGYIMYDKKNFKDVTATEKTVDVEASDKKEEATPE